MEWNDKNRGKHPDDPEYDRNYDAEEDYERYCDEQEMKEQFKRENDG